MAASRRAAWSTDLERFLATDGRDEAVARVRVGDRRQGHHLHLLPVRLGHRPDHGQGRARRPLGADRRDAASSWSTAPPPTCSPTGTATTSGTGRRRGSWSGCPTWRRSASCRGTRRPRGCSARCSATGRRRSTPARYLTSDCRGNLRRIHEAFERDTGLHLRVGHRAGDDVAQGQPGRHAVGGGQDQAVLLPHRPVRRAAAAHPQGHGVRQGDGPGHDPGRPRGRARASSS